MKYLSDEWAAEATTRFQADPAVREAAKGRNVAIQQVITGTPDGEEARFVLRVIEGAPQVERGEADKVEATITLNYETAVAIDKGELTPQGAFMQGRLKVKGNLMKLLQLQGLMNSLGDSLKGLERDY